jgi:transposase
MREMVVNIKNYFDEIKHNTTTYKGSSTKLTSLATGISESTVKVIMAAYKKNGEKGLDWSNFNQRGCPQFSVDLGIEPQVREYIRKANNSGEQINVEILKGFIKNALGCDVTHTSLWRALQRWGFEFGAGKRSAQLKESDKTIIKRRQYLRQKIANRDEKGTIIRPEVYLDESYINKNHSNDHTWYDKEEGTLISKPTGKGERLIILNAITEKGWVPNCKLVFSALKKTGDYHANMNWDNFSKWFKENLLKNIPENSLIILDNAPYHNVLTEEAFPKKTHSVKRFREWLTTNDIPWTNDMLKPELYELCASLANKPEFLLDEIARKEGHTILRTPPYHPELQPIETCWAIVKNHVAKHNDFTTIAKVRELVEEGFEKVTNETCLGLIKIANKQEKVYWTEDALSNI